MLILRCDLLVICQYWSHGFGISPHSPLYHLFVKHGSGSLLGRCSFAESYQCFTGKCKYSMKVVFCCKVALLQRSKFVNLIRRSCFVQGQSSHVVMLDFLTLFYEMTISVSDIKCTYLKDERWKQRRLTFEFL